MTAILFTGGDVALKRLGVAPGVLPDVETAEGIRSSAGQGALLRLHGVPLQRIQERTTVTREVLVMLPDLVLLRAQMKVLLERAVRAGLLEVPLELW